MMAPVLALLACTPCHQAIVDSYAKTRMGRSFFPITPSNRVEDFTRNNRLEHLPSRSTFTMTERDGRFFLRREHANGMLEKEIHYVLGSGSQARSYIHRTPQGRLLAMPVSWYSANGGFWQMAPGYDRPDHPHFRRKITYDCFFCHNAYPRVPPGASDADPVYLTPLPQGIDCARCHGDAVEHTDAPRRGNILNPRRLTRSRQLELCMQCHLETTTNPLPHAIRRFGRHAFSYWPGEPLSDYILHFDHPPSAPQADKFEVVSAVYRLRKATCFQKSELTCTSCHDPHRPGAITACQGCHPNAHHRDRDCAACHMPKRRPEDAPLTLVTDHWIRSHPTEPPATLPTYRGEVIAYYPEKIDDPIYLALAQVKDGTNPKATARGLQPRHPEAALVLADAHRKAGRAREAASLYRSAGNLLAAWRGLALIEFPSLQPVRRGLDQAPNDPFLLIVLGEIQRTQKQLADAQRSFELAIQADPDLPDAYINLGVTWAQQGQPFRAAEWFRQALAVGPANPTAIANLRLALSQDSSGPRRARD